MAAPSNTKWGSTVGGYGRIGISATTSSTSTQTTVHVEVWFWSKYSVSDSSNKYYYNNNATSATTLIGSKTIKTTVSSGSGWSTSNQVMLAEADATYSRGTSNKTINCAAKLSGVDRVGGTMYATASYSIPKLTSYTVSFNANGGSGAPGSQTKWYGKTLTLSSTKPSRTGYSFLGWSTSSTATSATYAAGGSYTANASDVLYAVWKANTYAVKYNANGGSGAPASQTKTYGRTLKLSSTKPTRTNYTFKGWATSASSTSVAYAAGASYTKNAAITLYAVWELAYTKPRITSFTVARCNSSGEVSDSGTYAIVKFSWACDKTVSSIKIEYKQSTASTYSAVTVTGTGTSGTVSKVIGGSLSTEYLYNIRVTVADASGNSNSIKNIEAAFYIIDIYKDGKGIAFGKPSEISGTMDSNIYARFRKNVYLQNGVNIHGYNSNGYARSLVLLNSANNYHFGAGSYDNSDGQAFYSGNKMSLRSRQNVTIYAPSQGINGRNFGENKVLWSGVWWPNETQKGNLSESILAQPNGVVFAISRYYPDTGEAGNVNWTYYFVPKYHVKAHNGTGIFMCNAYYGVRKYIYVSATSFVGHADNDAGKSSTNGVAYDNRNYVLRYVIGV